ncbi:MAG TPA: hypothetical protein DHW81_01705 [Nitrospiraceae bacterium]|nr:hypothetical protein [Nitrospiraceae bacterium]
MKKIFALMAALMMVVAFGGSTFAEEAKKAEEPAKAAEPAKEVKKASEKGKKVTGEVTAVDTKANTITVKGKKGESTCEVTADTKITAGEEAKTLADVKVGDKVTCKHVEKDGKSVCKSLKIKTAEKKEEMKKEEKKEEKKM